MEDLLHKSNQVERQLKAKSTSKFDSTYSWKSNWQNKKSMTKSKDEAKSKNSFAAPKGKMEINSSSRSHDIKCFRYQGVGHIASQCPNKRGMILLDNGNIESEGSSDDVDVAKPVNGNVLVTVKDKGSSNMEQPKAKA